MDISQEEINIPKPFFVLHLLLLIIYYLIK